MKMYSTLRSEHESILLLKGLSEKNSLPKGLLLAGPEAIKKAVGDFLKAKEADQQNEMRPATDLRIKPPSDRLAEFKKRNSSKSMLPIHEIRVQKDASPPTIRQESEESLND